MAINYQTSRLTVTEVFSESDRPEILLRIPELFTTNVVENLPPYFANIKSPSDAQLWLEKILSEGQLLLVEHAETDTVIGFVFIFVVQETHAHIGYLIGEQYWRKGYATELLKGFIGAAIKDNKWCKLIAGVDVGNNASSKLLINLGFIEQGQKDKGVIFYEYLLS